MSTFLTNWADIAVQMPQWHKGDLIDAFVHLGTFPGLGDLRIERGAKRTVSLLVHTDLQNNQSYDRVMTMPTTMENTLPKV